MAYPFPYEVRKCEKPIDEEQLRADCHNGLQLITVVQTTRENDPHGPRYWYYFRALSYEERR